MNKYLMVDLGMGSLLVGGHIKENMEKDSAKFIGIHHVA
jgi:hypothetical protein